MLNINQNCKKMKRNALLLFFLLSIVTASATELLTFSPTQYVGWIYTRSDLTLSTSEIGQYNIALYHYGDEDYTLISPMVQAIGDSIVVKVRGRSNTAGNTNYNYNPVIGSPTIELLNERDSVLKSIKYNFTTIELSRNFEVKFDINDIADHRFKLRLACWDSNIDSRLSIRNISVENYSIKGDVNGDGIVTTSDVTALYNYLLNNNSSSLVYGDVNRDGLITSGDVTAVYLILLGAQR